MSEVPNAALVKLFRAKVLFEELKAEVLSYIAGSPSIIEVHPEDCSEDPAVQINVVQPVPYRIALIAGDALQNARSALDYLVWELVKAYGSSPKRQALPVCTTQDGWNATHKARLKDVHPEAVEMIEKLQPFKLQDYRRHVLYALDELTNINKHRHIPLTILGSCSMEEFVPLELHGELRYLGSALAVTNPKIRATLRNDEGAPYADIAAFVAIAEEPVRGFEITAFTARTILWVEQFYFPRFARFFS